MFSVKTAVFTDATFGQITGPDNVGPVLARFQSQILAGLLGLGLDEAHTALGNFQVVANYFSFPQPPWGTALPFRLLQASNPCRKWGIRGTSDWLVVCCNEIAEDMG